MRLVQVISDYIRRSILTTQGDMIVRGVGQPERLAAGADRTYLRGRGAGVIPAYEAEPTIPACRVTLDVNQVIPTGVYTQVQFDGEDYDTTSNFNFGNHRYICSEVGIYLISANVYMTNLLDGNYHRILIMVNGVFRGGRESVLVGNVGTSSLSSSDILSLAVDDYIELMTYHDRGASISIIGGLGYTNYLCIHKLS